jgi:hypothetical protein
MFQIYLCILRRLLIKIYLFGQQIYLWKEYLVEIYLWKIYFFSRRFLGAEAL